MFLCGSILSALFDFAVATSFMFIDELQGPSTAAPALAAAEATGRCLRGELAGQSIRGPGR
jgi:hypothetical protein